MRKLPKRVIAVVGLIAVALVAGCAAGNQAVRSAKAARYRGNQAMIFGAMRAAVEAKYQIAVADEAALRIETTARWYTPEGLAASERGDDMRDVPDRSIHLRLIVRLVADGELWSVSVEPVMQRYFAGRPNPDRLTPDDPSVPGWASGKVDQMHAAIHDALATFESERHPPSGTELLPGDSHDHR